MRRWTQRPPGGWAAAFLRAALLVVGAPAARAGVNVCTTRGPYWVEVSALAIDPITPSTLYAGTASCGDTGCTGGVFQSTDSGASWTATGLTNQYVQAVVIDPSTPSTLYAGTDSGVFHSTDSGVSWTAINAGLTNTNVHALAIDPHTPNRLYARTDAGVFDIELVPPTESEGGCSMTPTQGSGTAWWLLVPAMGLWWARRRARETRCEG